VNKKIESYEQIQNEVEVLRTKNTSLMRTNAELKITVEESELSYKSKCGSMKDEIDFLQQQKADMIQGQHNQRWQTDNNYQQDIIELKHKIHRLTAQLSDSESQLIESEDKRVELRRQLDSAKTEQPVM
jgi:chromosome segregation ATPase